MSGNFSWMLADYHRLSPNCHTMITSCLPENLGSLPSKRRPNMSQLVVPITRAQAIAENCLKRLKEDERPFLSEQHCRFEDDITIHIYIVL